MITGNISEKNSHFNFIKYIKVNKKEAINVGKNDITLVESI